MSIGIVRSPISFPLMLKMITSCTLGSGGGGGVGSGTVMTSDVDSGSDVFSRVDCGEGLLEMSSCTGTVPCISESKIKRVVLVLAMVFLVAVRVFAAFEAEIVDFLVFAGGGTGLEGGFWQGFLEGCLTLIVSIWDRFNGL